MAEFPAIYGTHKSLLQMRWNRIMDKSLNSTSLQEFL